MSDTQPCPFYGMPCEYVPKAHEAEALRAENEELHRQQRAIINAVPAHYLLDPPDGGDVKLHEGVQRMAAEVERLRAALTHALNNGVGTQYCGEDDDCGVYICCGKASYRDHDADCWTVKARAALEGKP